MAKKTPPKKTLARSDSFWMIASVFCFLAIVVGVQVLESQAGHSFLAQIFTIGSSSDDFVTSDEWTSDEWTSDEWTSDEWTSDTSTSELELCNLGAQILPMEQFGDLPSTLKKNGTIIVANCDGSTPIALPSDGILTILDGNGGVLDSSDFSSPDGRFTLTSERYCPFAPGGRDKAVSATFTVIPRSPQPGPGQQLADMNFFAPFVLEIRGLSGNKPITSNLPPSVACAPQAAKEEGHGSSTTTTHCGISVTTPPELAKSDGTLVQDYILTVSDQTNGIQTWGDEDGDLLISAGAATMVAYARDGETLRLPPGKSVAISSINPLPEGPLGYYVFNPQTATWELQSDTPVTPAGNPLAAQVTGGGVQTQASRIDPVVNFDTKGTQIGCEVIAMVDHGCTNASLSVELAGGGTRTVTLRENVAVPIVRLPQDTGLEISQTTLNPQEEECELALVEYRLRENPDTQEAEIVETVSLDGLLSTTTPLPDGGLGRAGPVTLDELMVDSLDQQIRGCRSMTIVCSLEQYDNGTCPDWRNVVEGCTGISADPTCCSESPEVTCGPIEDAGYGLLASINALEESPLVQRFKQMIKFLAQIVGNIIGLDIVDVDVVRDLLGFEPVYVNEGGILKVILHLPMRDQEFRQLFAVPGPGELKVRVGLGSIAVQGVRHISGDEYEMDMEDGSTVNATITAMLCSNTDATLPECEAPTRPRFVWPGAKSREGISYLAPFADHVFLPCKEDDGAQLISDELNEQLPDWWGWVYAYGGDERNGNYNGAYALSPAILAAIGEPPDIPLLPETMDAQETYYFTATEPLGRTCADGFLPPWDNICTVNGVHERGEECDTGWHCPDGRTSCLNDSECDGIGDGKCLDQSTDGCFECKPVFGFTCTGDFYEESTCTWTLIPDLPDGEV